MKCTGLVAQLLRTYKDYRRIFDEMYYWAPAGGVTTEVDFLLLRNLEFVAVEVKSGRTFSEKWCKGLRAVSELKGLQRRVVVCPHGPVMRTEDGIDVMPFDYFANLLAENRL
jgi:predicted AAA+ superfamily ATPase